jgi:hypothetical protein
MIVDDEARAREVLAADLLALRTALNTGAGLNDPGTVYGFQVTLDRLERLAFNAPPDGERGQLIRNLRNVGYSAPRHGGMSTEAGNLMLSAADALCSSTHQGDREAIARALLAALKKCCVGLGGKSYLVGNHEACEIDGEINLMYVAEVFNETLSLLQAPPPTDEGVATE